MTVTLDIAQQSVILNCVFAMGFFTLLKCVASEIQVKTNQKAVKILQIKNSSGDGHVLVVNLQQLLLLWALITLLKLGSFNLNPGKDYLFVGTLALLLKLAHTKRDSLVIDIGSVLSFVILLTTISSLDSSESLLEKLDQAVFRTLLLMPPSALGLAISSCLAQPTRAACSVVAILLVGALYRLNTRLGIFITVLLSALMISKIFSISLPEGQTQHNSPLVAVNSTTLSKTSSSSDQNIELLVFRKYIEAIKIEIEADEQRFKNTTYNERNKGSFNSSLSVRKQYFVYEATLMTNGLCDIQAFDVSNFNLIFKKVLKLTWWVTSFVPSSLKHKFYHPSSSLQGHTEDCQDLPGYEIQTFILLPEANFSCVPFQQLKIEETDEDSLTNKLFSIITATFSRVTDYIF